MSPVSRAATRWPLSGIGTIGQLVEVRQLGAVLVGAPVVGVGGEDGALTGGEALQLERAGADAVGLQVDAAGHGGGRLDVAAGAGQEVGEGHARGAEVEDHGEALGAVGRLHRLDDGDAGLARAGRGRVLQAVEVLDDGVGVQRGVVVEGHALAEGDRVLREVVVALDGLGEEGLDLAVHVGGQRVVDAEGDDLVGRLGRLAGGQGGHVGLGAEDELAALDRVALGTVAGRCVVASSSVPPSSPAFRVVVVAAAGGGHEDEGQEHSDDPVPRCVAVRVLQDVPLAALELGRRPARKPCR